MFRTFRFETRWCVIMATQIRIPQPVESGWMGVGTKKGEGGMNRVMLTSVQTFRDLNLKRSMRKSSWKRGWKDRGMTEKIKTHEREEAVRLGLSGVRRRRNMVQIESLNGCGVGGPSP